jgi:dihydrolipoamide dehydrogenase
MSEVPRILIIGGGVAGYPAAIRASRLGAEVTLIERDAIGGTCLNWGCIPTKALLQSASVVRSMKSADLFGIRCHGYDVDFGAVMSRKDAVVSRLTRGVGALLKARKINVVQGTATFVDSKTVQVNETGEKIRADAILIATGSKPCSIPVEGIDGPDVMDSKQVLSLTSLPASVVVIGGGVIGVEFAQFLAAMGTRVTILELMPGLVPGVDREVASLLEKRTIMSGIEVVTGAALRGIVRTGTENVVTYTVGDKTATASADKVILTVGRRPDFSLIDVDRLGVRHENGAIVVDGHMQTNIPGIYAAGDVVGGIMLAHLASAEGECAVKNILGNREAMSYKAVPSCIYTSPEVASVGLTEEKARQSHDIRVGRFPFRANGKAVVLNDLEGMVKIISDGTSGEVLGVHIIGPHATDLIAEAVLGMHKKMTAGDFAHTIHPHPTLSEAIMEAAMTLTGGAIHVP